LSIQQLEELSKLISDKKIIIIVQKNLIMNSQINNKFLTTKSDDGKTIKHTQWSYLDLIKLKNICDETKIVLNMIH
jgi:hypothetical protein